MISAREELDRFLDKRTTLFNDALMKVVEAKFGKGSVVDSVNDLADLIRHTMILSDLHGRKRLLMEFDRAVERQPAGAFGYVPDATPIVPSLPFEEAVEDIVKREPRLAASAEEVARLYSRAKVFALAKAAEGNVDDRIAAYRTQKVKELLTKTVEEGEGVDEFSQAMRELGPWTRAYSDTIYRTNVSNSYTEGRFSQAKTPDIIDATPALEYVGVGDDRTRPNHRAAFGLIAGIDDSVWHVHKPPQGYNCRCGVRLVSRFELERKGLLSPDGKVIRYTPPAFGSAQPDPDFKV